MKRVSGKALLIIFALLLAALALVGVSSCAFATYTLAIEGDLYPGNVCSVTVKNGEGSLVYMGDSYTVRVTAGEDVASVEGRRVVLADTAKSGDAFTVQVTGENISVSATFTVQAPPISRVVVECPDKALAGETITLGVIILPEAQDGAVAEYSVTKGSASVVGNLLTIAQSSEYNSVIGVKATVGGVTSEEKEIRIIGHQPTNLTITSDMDGCHPGESLFVLASVEPSYVSYPLVVAFEKGGEYVSYDEETGILTVREGAPKGEEIVFKASCSTLFKRSVFHVGYPTATDVTAVSEGLRVKPGETKTFDFILTPSKANKENVTVTIAKGAELVDRWTGDTTFTVRSDVMPQNYDAPLSITFLLRYSDTVQTTITFIVEEREAERITLRSDASLFSYLGEGEKAVMLADVYPIGVMTDLIYEVTEGADLVEESATGVFTVKKGAERGIVSVRAKTFGGSAVSDPVSFSVRGRYVRVECTGWSDLVIREGQTSVWFVLPSAARNADRTILVPSETVDLVLEGVYDGTNETAYKGLYFYFRNAKKDRTVTLMNFATIADYGLGGTVMEFGSEGKTTVILEGINKICADSPRYLDNTGEIIDGEWKAKEDLSNRDRVYLDGKYGYNGANGGTAISGAEIVFCGEGSLVAMGGSGSDGTPAGRGANAEYYAGVQNYKAGNGGDGGAGGDSGVAIRAEKVSFVSGFVTAVAGNAGAGGAGGAGGNIDALAGYSVNAVAGTKGRDGVSGTCYNAVQAATIIGDCYSDTKGKVESRQEKAAETVKALAQKLSAFYGISVVYGSNVTKRQLTMHSDYPMKRQTDDVLTLQQLQFLTYTFSMMPKNCWREFAYISGNQVNIYLVSTIKNGGVLGLTDGSNNVWFATFDTEVRGVIYGGYYNIMLHEFTHVLHYNMTKSRTEALEQALKSYNKNDGVYGIYDDEENSAKGCCYLTSYSRTNWKEDAAETLSLCSVFSTLPEFLEEGCAVRAKLETIIEICFRSYETMSPLHTPYLFVYDHLFDEEAEELSEDMAA